MATHFVITDAGISETDQAPGQISVYIAPGESDAPGIREQFHLDDYDYSSTLDIDEVPRMDVSPERALIIWKRPRSFKPHEAIELGVSVVGLILTRDRLGIVANEDEIPFSSREFRGCRDVGDVFLRLLLHTIRHYVGHLRAIKQMSVELEKKITVSMENRHLLRMFSLSESLVYYIDAIEGNGAVLSKLRGAASDLGLTPKQQQFLDDIILENNQAARQAGIFSTILSGLMDARGTIINNNMTVLLKNLTLINIVFLPLNLIAGIWGMSEWTMATRGIDWRISYGGITLGLAALGLLTWVFVTRLIEASTARSARKSTGEGPARRNG
ncbi:MAG: magnesium transporter CorA family protein [Candidatus Krumholzibacteria bacterium]|nr:magnesium transporter CorA family protein [Candidatus Krumholzibacteria bacterium]